MKCNPRYSVSLQAAPTILMLLAAVVAVAGLETAVCAAPITYALTPVSLSQGFDLSGTITTDGTLGDVAGHVLSWSWSATDGAVTYSNSAPPSGASFDGLQATATELYVPEGPEEPFPTSTNGGFLFLGTGFNNSRLMIFTQTSWRQPQAELHYEDIYVLRTPSLGNYDRVVDHGSSPPNDPFVIATVVPEPSSLALLGLGVAAVTVGAIRRRRKQVDIRRATDQQGVAE
jgi:hypothetical protein